MRKIPINVSKKILADVSSGIYRTPANALKEIVVLVQREMDKSTLQFLDNPAFGWEVFLGITKL